ncbi:MAG TPA: catalase [Lachnospiraceae bacterium]|nr:catalase [Lachnospiraceae bacterium]
MGRTDKRKLHIKEHFLTITRHRHLVIKHCYHCGILWQGLRHDLSKYSPTEFLEGIVYYRGDRSPNVGARLKNGYSRAWLHHQGRNKHHFEYWNDYNMATRKKEPVRMPVRYVIEMFCDRVAASKIYFGDDYDDGKPLEYFELARGKRFMHQRTSDQLEKLIVMLKDKGEAKTFSYIRNVVKPLTIKNGTW